MSRKELGGIEGKVLLFGGVYGNLHALKRLRQIAIEKKIPASNVICTGDIMGYCAQPNECLELIRGWGIHSIAGNVEANIRDEAQDCGCNFEDGSRCDFLSNNWYSYVQSKITPQNKEWLHELPEFIQFSYARQKVFVLHGGLQSNAQFIFESTDWKVKANILKATQADVIVGGHCGLPFHSASHAQYWLNPGVIGMPANDGTTRVWYMVLDDTNGSFTFQHLSYNYDHEGAARLMVTNNLPLSYAETLSSGLWDNMDILEEPEKLIRGVSYALE